MKKSLPPDPTDAPEDRLLKLPEVRAIVQLGRTTIYRLIGEGTFPAPSKPGGCVSRWSEREVRGWMAQQLAKRAA